MANKAAATHAAQHAKGGADPITPESIGAAPGGFGLGGGIYNDYAAIVDDLNNAIYTGWYRFANNALNTPAKFANDYPCAGILFVSAGGGTIYQRYLSYAPGGVMFYREAMRYGRASEGGMVFTDWEYVNPLLVNNVEYRTTERCQGKPVYAKVVDCGSCPASGYKDIEYGTAGIVLPIRCEGTWSYSNRSTIPFESTDADQLHIGALGSIIRVKTGGKNFSSYKCTATVYYTKATD